MLEHISTNPKFNFSLIIPAPIEMVYAAWTDPAQLAVWWGPHGFTNPVCQLEDHPGGKLLIHMQDSFGTIHPMDGTFHEVEEKKRLVFTSSALNQAGRPILQVLNTVLFEEVEEGTRLTVLADVERVGLSAKTYLDGMEEGWSESLDRLKGFLSRRMS